MLSVKYAKDELLLLWLWEDSKWRMGRKRAPNLDSSYCGPLRSISPSHPHPAPQQAAPDSADAGAEMLGDIHEGFAGGVHHFGLVALRLIEAVLPLRDASLLAKADDRVLRDVKARADVRHGDADRVETSDLSALGHGERSELDPTRQTRQVYSPIVSGKVRRQARDQVKERLPLFREGVGEGHHKRLTRNITHVNVGVALREFLLEGFWLPGSWVAGVLCGLRRLVLGLGAVVAPTVAVIGKAVLRLGRAGREGQVQHCGRRCVDCGLV